VSFLRPLGFRLSDAVGDVSVCVCVCLCVCACVRARNARASGVQTSLTSGGRSVSIVRSWTKATEFLFIYLFITSVKKSLWLPPRKSISLLPT
jgi:hypothetical protein